MTFDATPVRPVLESARERGVLSTLDTQFALRLASLYRETNPAVVWGLAIACRQQARGHVCADLRRLESEGLVAEADEEVGALPLLPESLDLAGWLAELGASDLIGGSEPFEAEAEAEPTPLILDQRGRLYLRRCFLDEQALARGIRERAEAADLPLDLRRAEAGVARLVDVEPQRSVDAEGHAAETPDPLEQALWLGLKRPLSIVTGGPGTGKTTLVARLIALVAEQRLVADGHAPRVRLLAPTGKAAAAMTAAFVRQRESLPLSAELRAAMPSGAETVHRALLRARRFEAGTSRAAPRIEADVVVVDEASMVDLALMRRLFDACRGVERLVLLGDPDQLASVDAGAVLSELCSAGEAAPGAELDRSIVRLERSHRFESGGAIGSLAAAIRAGDAERMIALLDDPAHPEVTRLDARDVSQVRARLVESTREIQQEIVAASEPGAKLARLSSLRILCAHRRGPLGADSLCEVLDEAAAALRDTSSRSGWWRGRLLLVTRNAPDQDLWNGDVGLVEETPAGLRALFSDAEGGVRALAAGRLPAFESAIAMSVHKSQGSEFDAVDLVLGESPSRLMTRELLYTGVTRARERLRIHASEAVLREALARRVQRDSGLAERLARQGR